MRALLQTILFLSIIALSCSNYSSEISNDIQPASPCPIDTCQKVSIELGMPGYNYSAPFTCYKWTDWGTGLEVDWTDGGRILFFTFPNHRICQQQFRICAEDIFNCDLPAEEAGWQPIENCPKNNTITVSLDSCLYGQTTLFLDVFLVNND